MNRVAINPELVQWARERARLGIDDLAGRFPKLEDWENGRLLPTFKQLEDFARATRVPFGYLFLPDQPDIPMPIPDFRTVGNRRFEQVSPDLLDTIYAMQARQAWLREDRLECEASPLEFVGSAQLTDDPAMVGREMRRVAGLGERWAAGVRSWQEATLALRLAIEELGVIAVINGVVGNNTHRRLDVEEFRGFALCDDHAPLIFVNGADAKSAQMFTLAHELAHLWLGAGASGLSGFQGIFPEGEEVEMFCDRAAAEFLVPETELRACWPDVKRAASPIEALARSFKVSPIVAGRRTMELHLISRASFFEFYDSYTRQEYSKSQASPVGGDFYNNQNARVGKFFATRVIRAAKEGRIGFKQAYDLTGLNGGAFQKYASQVGIKLS